MILFGDLRHDRWHFAIHGQLAVLSVYIGQLVAFRKTTTDSAKVNQVQGHIIGWCGPRAGAKFTKDFIDSMLEEENKRISGGGDEASADVQSAENVEMMNNDRRQDERQEDERRQGDERGDHEDEDDEDHVGNEDGKQQKKKKIVSFLIKPFFPLFLGRRRFRLSECC